MTLDWLEFGTENCESIRIPGNLIGTFYCEDLETSFRRIGCNAIDKVESTHKFFVEIFDSKKLDYLPFNEERLKTTVYERLQDKNISSVSFSIDGEEYFYWVDWPYDNEYNNTYEKIYISATDVVYIGITKNNVDELMKNYVPEECDEEGYCFETTYIY